jgi:curved DNA-binding protein CbpA
MREKPIDFTVNYYEVLKLTPQASTADVMKAYRTLVHKCHPDRGGERTAFELLIRAKQVLSDPKKRAAFDRLLEESPLLFEDDTQSLWVAKMYVPFPVASSSDSDANDVANIPYPSSNYTNLSALISRTDAPVSVLLSWTAKNADFGLQLMELPGHLRTQGLKGFLEFLIGFFEQIYQDPEKKQKYFSTKSMAFFIKNRYMLSEELPFFATYWPKRTRIFLENLMEYVKTESTCHISELMTVSNLMSLVPCCPTLASMLLEPYNVKNLNFSTAKYIAGLLPQDASNLFIKDYIAIKEITPAELDLRKLVDERRFQEIMTVASNSSESIFFTLEIETVFSILLENPSFSAMQSLGMLLSRKFVFDETTIKKIIAMDENAGPLLATMLCYLLLLQETTHGPSNTECLSERQEGNIVDGIATILLREELGLSPLMVDRLLTGSLTNEGRIDKVASFVVDAASFQDRFRESHLVVYFFYERHQLWWKLTPSDTPDNIFLGKINQWKEIFSEKSSFGEICLSIKEVEEVLENFIICEMTFLKLSGEAAVLMRLLTFLSEKLAANVAADWTISQHLQQFIRMQLACSTMQFHVEVADIVLRHRYFFLEKHELLIIRSKKSNIIQIEWPGLMLLYAYNEKLMSMLLTGSILAELQSTFSIPRLRKQLVEDIGKKLLDGIKQDSYHYNSRGSQHKWYYEGFKQKKDTHPRVIHDALDYLVGNNLLSDHSHYLFIIHQFLESVFFRERVRAFLSIRKKLLSIGEISIPSAAFSRTINSLLSEITTAVYDEEVGRLLSQAIKDNPILIAIVCAKLKMRSEAGSIELPSIAINKLNDLLLIAETQYNIQVEEHEFELAKAYINRHGDALSGAKVLVLQACFCCKFPELQTSALQHKVQCHLKIESYLSKPQTFWRFNASPHEWINQLIQKLEAVIVAGVPNLTDVLSIKEIYMELILTPKNKSPLIENLIRTFPDKWPYNLIQWLLALVDVSEEKADFFLLKLFQTRQIKKQYLSDYLGLRIWYAKAILTDKIAIASLKAYSKKVQELLATDLYQQILSQGLTLEPLLLKMPTVVISTIRKCQQFSDTMPSVAASKSSEDRRYFSCVTR